MKKIMLIIQREYLSRVKKRSFLVLTFAVPLLIMGLMSLSVYLALKQGGDNKKVQVVDESGWFAGKLVNSSSITYSFSIDTKTAPKDFLDKGYDYVLRIPADMKAIQLLGEETPGLMTTSKIEEDLTSVAQSHRLKDAHIDSAMLASAQAQVTVTPQSISKEGQKDAHIVAATAVGLGSAMLIYIALFLYGAQVMRGVIEEKVSRIAEVVISSVKPFQLMMGKVIGVGLVGLTQFALWIVLTVSLSSFAEGAMMNGKVQAARQVSGAAVQSASNPGGGNKIATLIAEAGSLPIGTVICCFLFFFLFGYLLYSALFAAVGSAVESDADAQQFMLPLTLPLIFTFVLGESSILTNPHSPLAIWLSIIPFTSPVAMMMRIPFHVPWWQIACSMALMLMGFLFTTWVAGRIYRVGILMYGKKASYKELAKWFRYRG